MSTNCLVTKLKSVVNNDNLPRLNAIVFEVLPNPGSYNLDTDYTVLVTGSKRIEIVGTGSITLTVQGQSYTITDYFDVPSEYVNINQSLKCNPGSYKVVVKNKYEISVLGTPSIITTNVLRGIKFEINQLEYMTNLTTFASVSDIAFGEVNQLATNALTTFRLGYNDALQINDVKVNIEALKNNASLTYVTIRNNKSYGSIEQLSSLSHLRELIIPNSSIFGDIKAFLDANKNVRANGDTIIIVFLNADLTYNGLPCRTADEALAAFGIRTFSITVTFDSAVPDGYTIAAS